MKHTEALQETLYKELLGRIKETDTAVPYRRDGYWYYTRTQQGQAYPIFCRRKGRWTRLKRSISIRTSSRATRSFTRFGGMDVSPDGRMLLYLEDLTAFREYTLFVKDLTTGRIVDSIPDVWNGTAWAADNRTFFYMRADAAKRGHQVWRHVTGENRATDALVFQEHDVLNDLSVHRSLSGKFIFMPSSGFTSAEWRAVPTAAPLTAPVVIEPRRRNVEYSVDHGNGLFYMLTNDQATNFKVVVAADDLERIPRAGATGCRIATRRSSSNRRLRAFCGGHRTARRAPAAARDRPVRERDA